MSIENLKQDPRFDGLDVDFEIESARAWLQKKNRPVTENFLRYWLEQACRRAWVGNYYEHKSD